MLAIVGGAGLTLVVLAGFLYTLTGEFGAGHTKDETRMVTATVRTLVIESDAGDVKLEPGPRLVLHETHHYRGDRTPDVSHRLSGDALTVEDHGCKGFGLGDGCSTDFRVEVPPLTAVRLTTDAGDVTAIELDAVQVRADTDAGDVELDLVRVPSLVAAETDAGDVTLNVPFGTYAVTTDTDAGDDNVVGIVNDPRSTNRIDARTDAGDVTIRKR